MKRNFSVFILSIFVILFLVFAPPILALNFTVDEISDELYSRRNSSYTGVIKVWQIDCFEGGTGSRCEFLKSLCTLFELKNKGVYVDVISVNKEIAEALLKKNQNLPDIISFSHSFDTSSTELAQLSRELSVPVKSNLRTSGGVSAVPWCMGGYVLFNSGEAQIGKGRISKKGKQIYSVAVSQKAGYASLMSLVKKDSAKLFSQELCYKTGTAQDMFESYNYSLTADAFLGTQRDIYRLNSAATKNSARETKFEFLGGYTDLVQYISVLETANSAKKKTTERFIAYLLSADVQKKLPQIGMFPVTGENALYELPEMTELYNCLLNDDLYVPPLFDAGKLQDEALEFLQNGNMGLQIESFLKK